MLAKVVQPIRAAGDPDVCFSMILTSIAAEDWIGAAQHAENLQAIQSR